MSEPSSPKPAKLVASLFSSDLSIIDQVIDRLKDLYGDVDFLSNAMPFDHTDYYKKEMGESLVRRFASFKTLISPDSLPDIKLRTNGLEKDFSSHEKRRINIDPGYIVAERLVLATGKNYVHRIYLANGIYADLTLIFSNGSFRPLGWTYPDYVSQEIIKIMNGIRSRYLVQLKEII